MCTAIHEHNSVAQESVKIVGFILLSLFRSCKNAATFQIFTMVLKVETWILLIYIRNCKCTNTSVICLLTAEHG